jgi:hypothetical protein
LTTDAYKSVNYSRRTPALVEALKKQQIEVLQTRATPETFEARLRRLEAQGQRAGPQARTRACQSGRG